MEKYTTIQNDLIKKYHIVLKPNSTCYGRTHIHTKTRTICKWKQANSIRSTFTLLHEIGHAENNNSKMRRCEEEYYATVWALLEASKLGLTIPNGIVTRYQNYIDRELERGKRRGGNGYAKSYDLRKGVQEARLQETAKDFFKFAKEQGLL